MRAVANEDRANDIREVVQRHLWEAIEGIDVAVERGVLSPEVHYEISELLVTASDRIDDLGLPIEIDLLKDIVDELAEIVWKLYSQDGDASAVVALEGLQSSFELMVAQ